MAVIPALMLASLLAPALAPPAIRAVPLAPPVGPDVLDALVLDDAGDALGAWEALAAHLTAGLPAAGDEPVLAAELSVGVRLLLSLSAELERWPELHRTLADLASVPEATPWFLARRLAHAEAVALRHLGRPGEARARMLAAGSFDDVWMIGPFDNERGAGLDVPHAPERGIDPSARARGKEREVGWHPNPVRDHPLATLVLHALWRPNQQAGGYVATALVTDEPRAATLLLGTGGPYKVFVNDELVHARDVERDFVTDQDRVLLPLAAGVNHLLVKTGVEEGGWRLSLALLGPDGRPDGGVDVDASRLAEPHAPARALAAAPAPADERALLEQALAGATDPAARARLAKLLVLLHLLARPDDVDAPAAREAARAAVAAAPGDPQALYLLSRALREDDKSLVERRVNPRLQVLEDVLEHDPGHVGALLDLAAFYTDDHPIPERALALLERAAAAAPRSARVLLPYARALARRGLVTPAAEVETRLRAAPEAGTRSRPRLLVVDDVLGRGELRRALDLAEQGLARSRSPGTELELALELLADLGRADEAIALADDVLAGWPHRLDVRLDLARLLEFSGHVGEARARVERARAICPECVEPLWADARLAARAGELDRAVASLDALLDLDPGDVRARRYREHLSTGTPERFEAPYRRDARDLVGEPFAAADGDDPVELLDRTTVFRLWPDGTEHRYEHVVLRPRTDAGVRMLDTYPVVYPAGAHLEMLGVRVLRADGTSERAPRPRRGDRVTAGGAMRYRVYELPPLAPGDLVDVEYRVDQRAPGIFGRYFGRRHAFGPEVVDPLAAVRRSELVVIRPEDVPLTVVESRGEALERRTEARPERAVVVHRWIARDLPRPIVQTAMPPHEELVPLVDLATYPDWDAFAEWWWALIEREFTSTPAIEAKVEELVEGIEDERGRIEAVARFVGQEVRYNLWPFGTHGYEPYGAPTIFERRFGDCKDKTILLRVMLGHLGIEAVPVLLRARFRRPEERIDAAMVDHFNHCIAWLPPAGEREGLYLDATAPMNPIDYLRADDQGARVVRIDEDGAERARIPYAPPEANALRRRYEVDLEPDGSATVRLEDESVGHFGVRMRHRYGGEPGDREELLADEMAAGFGRVDVLSVETSELTDIGAPARLVARFTADGLWSRQGEWRGLPVGYDGLGVEQIALEADAERLHDVVLDRPYEIDTRVRLHLPDGVTLARPPAPARVEEEGLLSYELSVELADDEVEVSRRFVLRARRVPRDDYPRLRRALDAIRVLESRQILLDPSEGSRP